MCVRWFHSLLYHNAFQDLDVPHSTKSTFCILVSGWEEDAILWVEILLGFVWEKRTKDAAAELCATMTSSVDTRIPVDGCFMTWESEPLSVAISTEHNLNLSPHDGVRLVLRFAISKLRLGREPKNSSLDFVLTHRALALSKLRCLLTVLAHIQMYTQSINWNGIHQLACALDVMHIE